MFVCFSFLRGICVLSFLEFRVGFVFVCFGFSRGICGQSAEFLSLERCLLEIANDHQCASLTTIQSEFARTINVTFGILFREHPKNHRSTLEFVRRQTKFDALIEDPTVRVTSEPNQRSAHHLELLSKHRGLIHTSPETKNARQ